MATTFDSYLLSLKQRFQKFSFSLFNLSNKASSISNRRLATSYRPQRAILKNPFFICFFSPSLFPSHSTTAAGFTPRRPPTNRFPPRSGAVASYTLRRRCRILLFCLKFEVIDLGCTARAHTHTPVLVARTLSQGVPSVGRGFGFGICGVVGLGWRPAGHTVMLMRLATRPLRCNRSRRRGVS